MANTCIKVILRMPCLSLNNKNLQFAELAKKTWGLYTNTEVLPTIDWVKLMNKREFAKAAPDEDLDNFLVYFAALEANEVAEITIYLS